MTGIKLQLIGYEGKVKSGTKWKSIGMFKTKEEAKTNGAVKAVPRYNRK